MLRSLVGFVLLVALVWLPHFALGQADPNIIVVVSWNLESGDIDPNVVANRIGGFQDVDLWGFSEVGAPDAETFESGAEVGEGANFEGILGTTGGGDRLLIVYDADRFELLDDEDLTGIVWQNVRAALIGHFRERQTGLEFKFMVNHLHRGNANNRHEQARVLNAWAAGQSLPVIAVGDYNFDYDIVTEAHDLGFDNMTANGVLEWVRPDTLVLTQCSATNSGTCQFDSVLDFVFVSGEAQDWQAESVIIVEPGDFPDDATTPDHRPVSGTLNTAIQPIVEPVTREMLLEQIERLEAELAALRALVEQMP
jgi:hypothetical protein